VTIKSMDMQVLVQKIGDIARVRQVDQTGTQRRQQEFNELINNQTNKNSKTIKEINQDKARLNTDKDKEKRKSNKKSTKIKTHKEKTDDNLNFDMEKGNNIDIKI